MGRGVAREIEREAEAKQFARRLFHTLRTILTIVKDLPSFIMLSLFYCLDLDTSPTRVR